MTRPSVRWNPSQAAAWLADVALTSRAFLKSASEQQKQQEEDNKRRRSRRRWLLAGGGLLGAVAGGLALASRYSNGFGGSSGSPEDLWTSASLPSSDKQRGSGLFGGFMDSPSSSSSSSIVSRDELRKVLPDYLRDNPHLLPKIQQLSTPSLETQLADYIGRGISTSLTYAPATTLFGVPFALYRNAREMGRSMKLWDYWTYENLQRGLAEAGKENVVAKFLNQQQNLGGSGVLRDIVREARKQYRVNLHEPLEIENILNKHNINNFYEKTLDKHLEKLLGGNNAGSGASVPPQPGTAGKKEKIVKLVAKHLTQAPPKVTPATIEYLVSLGHNARPHGPPGVTAAVLGTTLLADALLYNYLGGKIQEMRQRRELMDIMRDAARYAALRRGE